jgi:hypothetical protein
MRCTLAGMVALQFGKSGDAGIGKICRTHYISRSLSELKKQKRQKRLDQLLTSS